MIFAYVKHEIASSSNCGACRRVSFGNRAGGFGAHGKAGAVMLNSLYGTKGTFSQSLLDVAAWRPERNRPVAGSRGTDHLGGGIY